MTDINNTRSPTALSSPTGLCLDLINSGYSPAEIRRRLSLTEDRLRDLMTQKEPLTINLISRIVARFPAAAHRCCEIFRAMGRRENV